MREVTGSSPVSSTRKTAVFERKQRFFAFCLTLFCQIVFDHSTATDRQKRRPPEALLLEGGFLFSAAFFLGPKGLQLLFHFLNQLRQFLLTLLLCGGIDISGNALAVDLWGVPPLPEVVVDLGHTPGSRLAVLSFYRPEGRG